MGQYCFSRVIIESNTPYPKEFKNADTLTNALIKFYADNHSGDTDITIQITDLVYDRVYMEFEMHSGRTVNLVFQLELLISYLKHLELVIEEFNSSGYIALDSGDMCLTADDF